MLSLFAGVLLIQPGCVHTPTVTSSTDTNGVTTFSTNIVTTLDPQKLQAAADVIEPAVSRVLRRAIARSPQHAGEIGNYARAVGNVFCKARATQQFSPLDIALAADAATQGLQANLPDELFDAKNAGIALYKVLIGDQVMIRVPGNAWASAVCGLFCDSIDQALKDSGQVGVK